MHKKEDKTTDRGYNWKIVLKCWTCLLRSGLCLRIYRASLDLREKKIPSWTSREIFLTINSKSKTKQLNAEKNE